MLSSGYDDESRKLPVIQYEYPFNERIRTYLRLEHLFDRLVELAHRDAALDHHFALTTLFEIMDVASRADLKSDVMKDVERQKQLLDSYRGNPAISEKALDQVIGQLDECFVGLNSVAGKAGAALAENDWLMSIRSRAVIPGGTCEFDLPSYYAWQHKTASVRQADLQRWIAPLVPLASGVHQLLRMLRDSGAPQKVMAVAGHFQQPLTQGRTFQLVRLSIDPGLDLVPEISGNRLMISVRMMRLGADARLHLHADDVAFELALCS